MHFQHVLASHSIWLRVLVFAGMWCLTMAAAEPSNYLMDVWTNDNDLPDSSVTAITQTPDGYLWIGTFNGLARFDGVRFVTFDPANTPALKHARVFSLFTDAGGTLWINTFDGSLTSFRNGVFTYERQAGQVNAVFTVSNQTYFATLSRSVTLRTENAGTNEWQTLLLDRRTTANSYCQDADGVIWCLLRDRKIARIIGTNFLSEPLTNAIGAETANYLTSDRTGRIWAGTDNKIERWNGSQFEDETPTNGEPSPGVSFIFCTSDNTIWAFANGSVRQAKNRQWIKNVDSWADLAHATAIYVGAYEERSGDVWFRQFGQGLFHADADGTLERVSSANGLPDNRVTCFFEDREGNLWLGVDHGGLVRLRQRQFQNIGGDDLKDTPVATVCADNQDNLWIGTFGKGLIRWRAEDRQQRFDLPSGVDNKSVFFSACPDAHGRLWLSAGREDLFFLETNQVIQSLNSIHGIKVIFADREGRIWMGRHSQLTCWTNGEILDFGAGNGFDRQEVRALTQDREGNIWIGTESGVLYRFADGKFTSFKPEDGKDKQAIRSLLPDEDGGIWAGTFRGGLLRFKAGKFIRYKMRDGLPNDIISQILDDGLGKLWFGSHKGVFCVPKQSFDAFDRGEIQSLPGVSYGLSDGLPSLECSDNYQPSAWRTRDGKLWFATVKGLVAVDPQKVRSNRVPPPVIIEGLLVDGKAFGTAGAVRIPPGKHQLDFQFTALSFAAPDKVRFRYQLSGFDNGWVEAGTRRTAHYGPLPPGDYQLRVAACNNDGVWNETGASLALTQQPFIWQTWWFKFVTAFAAVLVIAGAVRYAATRNLQRKLERLKQQRAIERERERIAKDIHDDLGAGLTQIMLQSSLARRAPSDRMQTDLSQISETARDLVKTMDEIVWAIDPENDTLDGLVTYTGKYVQDFLTAATLRCRLDLPPEPPTINVSAETRHNLFLAIKEALNNVAKHAQATEVQFELKLQPGTFAFVIKDDGRGFSPGESGAGGGDPQRISSGHGLKNLSRRLESVGGICIVDSAPGQGTRVELIVPICKTAAGKQIITTP